MEGLEDEPELWGVTEIGDFLAITRQRAGQLASDHPDFPRPVGRIRAGRIYRAADIRDFAANWRRRPGRPPRKKEED